MRPRRARKSLLVARIQFALDVGGSPAHTIPTCVSVQLRERQAVLNPTKGKSGMTYRKEWMDPWANRGEPAHLWYHGAHMQCNHMYKNLMDRHAIKYNVTQCFSEWTICATPWVFCLLSKYATLHSSTCNYSAKVPISRFISYISVYFSLGANLCPFQWQVFQVPHEPETCVEIQQRSLKLQYKKYMKVWTIYIKVISSCWSLCLRQ